MSGDMKCNRCGGLQLWAHFANDGGASCLWDYDGWRCMNCGDVIDPVILENRRLQHDVAATRPLVPYGSSIIWLRWRRDGSLEDRRSAPRARRPVSDAIRRRQVAG